MSALPDEMWRQILEIGILNSKFSCKDLCCISISCRRLHRLSSEDSIWSHLLSSDFPTPPQQQQEQSSSSNPTIATAAAATTKSVYKIRFRFVIFHLVLSLNPICCSIHQFVRYCLLLGLRRRKRRNSRRIEGRFSEKRVKFRSTRGK